MRVVYRRSRDEPGLRHAVRPTTATLRDHPARPRPNAYLVPLPRKIRGGAPAYPDAAGTATRRAWPTPDHGDADEQRRDDRGESEAIAVQMQLAAMLLGQRGERRLVDAQGLDGKDHARTTAARRKTHHAARACRLLLRHENLRENSAAKALFVDDLELQVLLQVGERAAPRADRDRDRRQLEFIDKPQARQRCGERRAAVDRIVPSSSRAFRSAMPAPTSPKTSTGPHSAFSSVWQRRPRLVVHRRCDRALGRRPVRAHDLVAAAAHRVDAGLPERAEVAFGGIVVEPLEHPLVGAAQARSKPVEGHDHPENDLSLAHGPETYPLAVIPASPVGSGARAAAGARSAPAAR
jgi:hypothetical protein